MDITQFDLITLFNQIDEAKQKFDKLPPPKGNKETIDRVGRSREFLGMAKLINYLAGNKTEAEWHLFLNGGA